eukprot:144936-Hanusia_phi.AAC.1
MPAKSIFVLFLCVLTFSVTVGCMDQSANELYEPRWRFKAADVLRLRNATRVVSESAGLDKLSFIGVALWCPGMSMSRIVSKQANYNGEDLEESNNRMLARRFRVSVISRGFGAHMLPCKEDKDCGVGMVCEAMPIGSFCVLQQDSVDDDNFSKEPKGSC